MRRFYVKCNLIIIALTAFTIYLWPPFVWSLTILVPLFLVGLRDFTQERRAVLRNFPIIGHFRYFFEMIRPEIHQYFVESDKDGVPFNRERRSLVYQRSKRQVDTVPFGTKLDFYTEGYEWVNHSMAPREVALSSLRMRIGGKDCQKPYSCSLLNISAMSYGSLSKNAVMALNKGAREGDFAHNTGEGGISSYHLHGGDLIWQIGTGYFGCRDSRGDFDAEAFEKQASLDQIKMIELKISQGAKPGHGGILPASKLTKEIAAIRGVKMGEDVLSPSAHKTFSCPKTLLEFIAKLRRLSGGKPIGIKLCVGKRREFISLCKAMHELSLAPDYIAIDGGEGGTGAAPLEFCNHIGSPLKESLIFAHNALIGFNLRSQVKIIASGKVTSAFEVISYLAIGADICYAARAFMLSLGCIQALKCNTNECPVGVATQDRELVGGLTVKPKTKRVHQFHEETLASVAEMIGAMGLDAHEKLRPWHLMRRIDSHTIRHYGELYDYIEPGSLLLEDLPAGWQRAVLAASSGSFTSSL